jgi:hypothetical protein
MLAPPSERSKPKGINLIPDAMAHDLARTLDLTVTTEIVQRSTVGHTRAGGYHRLVFQPTFAGNVERGADYTSRGRKKPVRGALDG